VELELVLEPELEPEVELELVLEPELELELEVELELVLEPELELEVELELVLAGVELPPPPQALTASKHSESGNSVRARARAESDCVTGESLSFDPMEVSATVAQPHRSQRQRSDSPVRSVTRRRRGPALHVNQCPLTRINSLP